MSPTDLPRLQRAKRTKRAKRTTLASLALACALTACREPHGQPGDYAHLGGHTNPSGRLAARLIRWRQLGDRPDDTYFVIVTAASFIVSDSALATTREGNSVLHARNGEKLQLEWPADTELVIRCTACGMRPGDVLHTADRAGPVHVTFIGLPGVQNK